MSITVNRYFQFLGIGGLYHISQANPHFLIAGSLNFLFIFRSLLVGIELINDHFDVLILVLRFINRIG